MFHLVARGANRSKLWRTWAEGCALWRRVGRACPGLLALVLMPDHLHLLHGSDVRLALAAALSGHTRSVGGPGVEALPSAVALVDAQKRRRTVRYVHLNPCRAGLCRDPLEWPLSTHLDACGLMVEPVVRPRRDPAAFHRYVSSDPHVSVTGTELPAEQGGRVHPLEVLHAVSVALRTPVVALRRRSSGRSLYLTAARELSTGSQGEIGALVDVGHSSVSRASAPATRVRALRRVLGDPRLRPLLPGDDPWRRLRAPR